MLLRRLYQTEYLRVFPCSFFKLIFELWDGFIFLNIVREWMCWGYQRCILSSVFKLFLKLYDEFIALDCSENFRQVGLHVTFVLETSVQADFGAVRWLGLSEILLRDSNKANSPVIVVAEILQVDFRDLRWFHLSENVISTQHFNLWELPEMNAL